jgi:hypothetical protein
MRSVAWTVGGLSTGGSYPSATHLTSDGKKTLCGRSIPKTSVKHGGSLCVKCNKLSKK